MSDNLISIVIKRNTIKENTLNPFASFVNVEF